MELQRKEYPALLQALSPAQAVDVLNGRMRHVSQLNTQIADWLQERRRVEEQYVQGLRKLANRHPPDEASELGIFSVPWQKIVSATGAVAASHEHLARKIESDVERPLREFCANDRDVQAMGNMSGNLTAMAKELDAARKKSEKQRAKGAKARPSEVGEAAQEEQNAELQWDSQAPFVYEKLQAVDESRLNHLRDALTQFETHEIDQIERSRVTAEDTLNVLLTIETADEIQTWSLRLRSGDIPQSTRKMSNPPVPASPARNLAPPPVPSAANPADDARSQKSGSKDEKHSSNPLKRFGTVLGRRRQSAHPYGRAVSPEHKSSSNLGSAFGFGKNKNKDKDLPPPSSSADRPRSPLRRLSSRRESERAPTPDHPPPSRDVDEPNGFGTATPKENETAAAPVNGTTQDSIPELEEPLAVPQIAEPKPEPEKDAEGFSVPPSALDAITEAEREAGFSQGEGSSTPQFKLDIRNAPIQEEGEDNDAAMASVVNTLRAQAAQPKRNSTLRGRRDVRNTIFVPNPAVLDLQSIGESSPPPALPTTGSAPSSASLPTASSPTVFPPIIPPPQPASPVSKLPHRALLSDEHAAPASDTQSIRSGRSLSSSASSTVKHPDLHEPGLNASLVETVSAWFEQGNVTKAMVIGQVALAFNPTDITAGPFGTERIRLENFPVLEKVAPNPAFIEQAQDNPGAYTVDLAKITKTSVAFHYQLHIENTSAAALAPIILTPLWKAEQSQISAILNYSLNPLFDLHGASSVTIRNLVLIVRLEPGSRASACQSKPAGTFSRDKALIYWRLGDVTLARDAPAQSIRARFITDADAKPGNTEARWEISGAESLALGSGLGVSVAGTEEKEDDPFADEENRESEAPVVAWKGVPSVKRIVSGTYMGV
ncbi:Muniscin C-terminal mu homology domain-containing protein [Boeremia exigua]|uniref:Muniscin C-terminal mu homology domain-containing protein n=1 Tax=Boeremia exigua TaxID=749465 RepID=UPI001E8DC60C|nr:Muniscin C-terminal mu homology domain-containing protein [Boeremia exigua]KAH6643872.1 Muniscin C-terminal mu homology domain-containing protein [Boeremia exigua]